MKILRLDFEKCSLSVLLKVIKHHCEILERASQLRLLDFDELDFMSLLPCYECGIISEFELRRGCIVYFG